MLSASDLEYLYKLYIKRDKYRDRLKVTQSLVASQILEVQAAILDVAEASDEVSIGTQDIKLLKRLIRSKEHRDWELRNFEAEATRLEERIKELGEQIVKAEMRDAVDESQGDSME